MGSASLGKLFFDISGDTSRLNASLKQAMDAAEAANVKITRAGQGIIASFDAALNPTKRLAEEIRLLELAGRSSGDILAVMGKKIEAATSAARDHAQPVDSIVKKYSELADQSKASNFSIQNLGQSLTSFAQNPLAATQQGFQSLLGTLGPVAVGVGAIATAAVAAGVAVFGIAVKAGEAAENLKNLSASTGLSVRDLQVLDRVAKEMGLGDLTNQITKLQAELGDPAGGKFTNTLAALNIQLRDTNGETRPVLDLLGDFREKLLAIQNPAERTQLAIETFGAKTGKELSKLLLGSELSLEQWRVALEKAGVIQTQEAIDKAAAFDDKLDALGRKWKWLSNAVSEAAVDIALGVTKAFDADAKYEAWRAQRQAKVGGIISAIAGPVGLGNLDAFGKWYGGTGQAPTVPGAQELEGPPDTAGGRLAALTARDLNTARQIAEQSGATGRLLQLTIDLGQAQTTFNNLKNTGNEQAKQSASDAIIRIKAQIEGIKTETETAKKLDSQWEKVFDSVHKISEADGKAAAKIVADGLEAQAKQILDAAKKADEIFSAQIKDFLARTKEDEAADAVDARIARDVEKRFEAVAEASKKHYESIIANVRDGAGQVFDAMLTKGQNVFTSLAHFVSGLFNTLARSIFQNLAQGLAQILLGGGKGGGLSGAASQAGGGIGGLAGLGGAGGLSGFGLPALGASFGASAFGGLLGGGIGGQISGATAGAVGSVLGFAALGGSFTPLLFALLTNPATWAVAAGLIAVGPLIAAFKGKNAFTAGSPEIKRDLGVDVGSSTVQQIFGGLGVSESQAYPIRKDLLSSPVVLRQLGDIAKQQGQYGDFLKKLESIQTSWGTFNFRQAFELGTASGDWTKLDEAFTAAFTSSKALQDNLPDWTQKLLIAGHAIETVASATDLLVEGLKGLKASIEQGITTAKDMYQTFLETGVITDAFAAKITELGGDLEVFKRLANLSKISTEFAGLADHLRQTGEVLPRLRELFTQFGGDLSVLDNLGALPGLQTGLANINDFIGGLQQLLNQLSPVQQVLSGQWGADTWGGLAALGLDPSKLTQISDLIRSEKGWDQAVSEFQKTGRLQRGGILEQNIWQYGGAEGATAIERNRQGFNTITPELLAKVRAAMDAAYQAELKSALTYLGTIAKTTSDQIAALTTAVETQFTIVSGNITIALDAAKQAVVDQLGLMLDKLAVIAANTTPATTQPDTGGGSTTAGTGDDNARDGGTGEQGGSGGGGGPMIELHVYGNVYGLADVERVVTDSVDNAMRRGWNPALARR